MQICVCMNFGALVIRGFGIVEENRAFRKFVAWMTKYDVMAERSTVSDTSYSPALLCFAASDRSPAVQRLLASPALLYYVRADRSSQSVQRQLPFAKLLCCATSELIAAGAAFKVVRVIDRIDDYLLKLVSYDASILDDA